MRRNLFHFFLVVSLIFALVSCASFPKNPDLTQYDPAQGYRFDNLKPGHNNTDSLFVIVAFPVVEHALPPFPMVFSKHCEIQR